jgi:hypothetical protein
MINTHDCFLGLQIVISSGWQVLCLDWSFTSQAIFFLGKLRWQTTTLALQYIYTLIFILIFLFYLIMFYSSYLTGTLTLLGTSRNLSASLQISWYIRYYPSSCRVWYQIPSQQLRRKSTTRYYITPCWDARLVTSTIHRY